MKTLSFNPRTWSREDVDFVSGIVGKDPVQILPAVYGSSPTWAQISETPAAWTCEPGKIYSPPPKGLFLRVWYYEGGMEVIFSFPITKESEKAAATVAPSPNP